MKDMIKLCVFTALFVLGASEMVYAQNPVATTPSTQVRECASQRKIYGNQVRGCIEACRIRDNASRAQVQRCQDAYNAYRKGTGQSVAAGTSPEPQSFIVDSITAQFSVRNGRLNKFKLIGEHSELEERAAKVCIFKLPPTPLIGQRGSPFKDKAVEFRKQGKGFAYQLSGITWSEDGRSNHYPCKVDAIDLVAID